MGISDIIQSVFVVLYVIGYMGQYTTFMLIKDKAYNKEVLGSNYARATILIDHATNPYWFQAIVHAGAAIGCYKLSLYEFAVMLALSALVLLPLERWRYYGYRKCLLFRSVGLRIKF